VRKENAESRSLGEIGPCAASGGSILDTGRGGCRGIRLAHSRGTPHERPERPVVEPQPSVPRSGSSQAPATLGKSALIATHHGVMVTGEQANGADRSRQGSARNDGGLLVDVSGSHDAEGASSEPTSRISGSMMVDAAVVSPSKSRVAGRAVWARLGHRPRSEPSRLPP
jgi:hypothetical protein